MPGAAEHEVPDRRRDEEDKERYRHAENAAMADRLDETREARDVAAAGQEFAEAADEDHHRQRDEDGVGADIGDHQSHDQPRGGADGYGRGAAEDEGPEAGIGPAMRLKDPGERQAAEIGGVGNGEIEPTREDRHQHGEGEEPELRELEGDRTEVLGGEEARRGGAEGDDHDEQEADEAEDLGADQIAYPAVGFDHHPPPLTAP